MGNYIKKQYREYINETSNAVMTISYELSNYIWKYITKKQPRTILDLGSGFSSFIFRFYQKEYSTEETIVVTVDTQKKWLNKTEKFLKDKDLSIENLYTYREFKELSFEPFDYVLFDLGPTDKRHNYLDMVFKYKKENCPLIIDDVHNKAYKDIVLEKCHKLNMKTNFLIDDTFDTYGRFAVEINNKRI